MAAAALAWLTAGCVDVKGGAVEASWVLRTDDGRAITECGCTSPRVATVAFSLLDADGTDACAGVDGCRFSCGRQSGATPFRLAPGRYAISLEPLGESGQPLPEVGRPASILREVIDGQVTEMDAFPLIAGCDENCTGMNTSGVCMRR